MPLADIGSLPGMQASVTTAERQIWWGHQNLQIRDPFPLIGSSAIDAGSTVTSQLRAGLVMAKKTSDGKWYEYDVTQTDGRQVALGVLLTSRAMLNSLSQVATDREGDILIGGLLKAGQLIGLDSTARRQLAKRFIFDDDILGLPGWSTPFVKEVTKAADYTVVAADNGTSFVSITGAVVFTLPAIGKGYRFKFRCQVDAAMTVASAEGDNIVAVNDIAADSVAFSTANLKIGGAVEVYSNDAGDKWIVENRSAGANTITVAT